MKTPIALYVPNLIGYARICCMIGSFYFAQSDINVALTLYVMNFAGDAVDGFFARLLGQSSTFGAALDMLTDRVSTAGLCAFLAVLYPKEAFFFVMLIVLDIFSHWFHQTAAKGHHKDEQGNFILRMYYGCYPIFGYLCLSQEFYYMARWYMWFHDPEQSTNLSTFTDMVLLPGLLLKQVVNVAQLWNAAESLIAQDSPKVA
eukprot:CAMPEP_0185771074 /NCGR_PEP_ID=MMETSP1174-20130828/63042_1 /TAXON_ID=35687 /ORGANISM="Dictyocha speculum, Strain CCMP1381" /LENGTH=201 /DNA_ID=CAMNT_0028456803 /DNA_START=78 /DNA_END=683 /DNA_ORIENTATION=+